MICQLLYTGICICMPMIRCYKLLEKMLANRKNLEEQMSEISKWQSKYN